MTRTCRFCGCTDLHACAGGCHWVGYNICSACAFARTNPHGKIDGTKVALAIVVDGRFFYGFGARRIKSAWSVAGATLFLPGSGDKIVAALTRVSKVRPSAICWIVALDVDAPTITGRP